MTRVVLAMSGGVDSSVAAHLLLQAGHEVIGVFMRHGHSAPATTCGTTSSLTVLDQRPGHKQGCCTASDADDARRVADRFDIPFYAIDFQDEFGRIIDYFVAEYAAARTPNPCVVCNNDIKFGRLFDYADSVGADFVATGHYARIADSGDGKGPALVRGLDEHKDQSYVLFGIERQRLARMMLPVGEFQKDEIRELARSLGLAVAEKRDSQEICFVPNGDHAAFVREQMASARGEAVGAGGEIVDTEGHFLGHHEGLEKFTIGQRKGLGVALGEPRFVIRLEADTRRVVVGKREELARHELTARGANWLANEPISALRCAAKIRYNSRLAPAWVEALAGGRLRVEFDEPQFGVAPGQAVVCYDGDRVLGGGWIE